MELSKLASAIYNDIQSGVSGINANPTMSMEQLEDEIVAMREVVVKELWLKGILKKEDMMQAINCLEVSCADQNKCCNADLPVKNALHCEIPQLMDDLGKDAIYYIGATDRSNSFNIYFNREAAKMHAYKKRNKNKPYVYIERTPNVNNMYDCWIFNAPFLTNMAIIGVFKDPRQLEEFQCCEQQDYLDMGVVSTEVKTRIVNEKMKLYRQYIMPPHQTDLTPR